MSVKHAMLALLAQEPMYGYQLRVEFERRTGNTWPLNIGQVYTTLSRLERDGLVEGFGDDVEGHSNYRITAAGRNVVDEWFSVAVGREQPPRDELAMKLAIAVTMPGVDVPGLLQRQRSATLVALQGYTRQKRVEASKAAPDLAWSLVLDSLIFAAEAEVRWLDHCEARVRQTSSGKASR